MRIKRRFRGAKGRPEGEPRHGKRRQFVPAKELADAPSIDFDQLRADLYAVIDPDPTPRYWID